MNMSNNLFVLCSKLNYSLAILAEVCASESTELVVYLNVTFSCNVLAIWHMRMSLTN